MGRRLHSIHDPEKKSAYYELGFSLRLTIHCSWEMMGISSAGREFPAGFVVGNWFWVIRLLKSIKNKRMIDSSC